MSLFSIRSATIVRALVATGALACGHAPSPLAPHWSGPIGLPHSGVLAGGIELPPAGRGYSVLRANDRHFAVPRLVTAITRTAGATGSGSPLVVGDLSAPNGGRISGHASHRTGRDADLLLYMTTLEGTPVTLTGFVHVGLDGLAWDSQNKRFLRFDVAREWLLVKALLSDPEARIQWLFVSHAVRAMLLDWARARGEPDETLLHALETLVQPPKPAQSHDDHIHVRVFCSDEELFQGCEPGTNTPSAPARTEPDAVAIGELVSALFEPLKPLEPSRDAKNE